MVGGRQESQQGGATVSQVGQCGQSMVVCVVVLPRLRADLGARVEEVSVWGGMAVGVVVEATVLFQSGERLWGVGRWWTSMRRSNRGDGAVMLARACCTGVWTRARLIITRLMCGQSGLDWGRRLSW